MTTDNSKHQELKLLIEESSKQKERECAKYLEHCKDLLVTGTPSEFIHQEAEYRGNKGDSDYIISCKTTDGTGDETNKAYIWELKAPQCYLFKEDTKQRLMPSDDLVKAENQLFHYYHEYRGSDDFKSTFDVHTNDIYFGGIIIGTKERYVDGTYKKKKQSTMYSHAKMIRKRYIYRIHGIELLTWDTILKQLKVEKPEMNK